MLKIRSIVDNVRRYLLGRILEGELRPGQQVKEQELAFSLGISRPPVREALKLLEAEGLIIRKPNRGAFVATITEQDAWEIYTLKCTLYEMATRLGFDKISNTDIEEWQQIVAEMEKCVSSTPPDVIQYQFLNKRFHGIMLRISGHQRLQKFSQVLHNQMSRFSCMSLTDEAHLKESLGYHKEILDAFKKRDKERALKMTREHITHGLHFVQELIAHELRPIGSTGT